MSVPFYDPNGNRLGACGKRELHERGLWHRTAIILVVRAGKILTLTRGEHQTYPGLVDLPGGHESDVDLGDLRRTCLREASEEMRVTIECKQLPWELDDFELIGAEGAMLIDLAHNKERSSLYGALLPNSAKVDVCDLDDDEGQESRLDSEFRDLDNLREHYVKNHEFAADGLRRVLAEVDADPLFRKHIEEYTVHRDWIICFADSHPGEPGTGGYDNDYYAEFRCHGSRKEAIREARRISFENYRGDLVFWLKEAT